MTSRRGAVGREVSTTKCSHPLVDRQVRVGPPGATGKARGHDRGWRRHLDQDDLRALSGRDPVEGRPMALGEVRGIEDGGDAALEQAFDGGVDGVEQAPALLPGVAGMREQELAQGVALQDDGAGPPAKLAAEA
jgi:hypothetical protein